VAYTWGLGGPTGVGDEWVHVGPIKLFLDGGMLNGSAYMREPWPKGPTYQINEDGYRGLSFIQPEQLRMVVEEGVKRHWQMTAHTAGEGAMDVLLERRPKLLGMVHVSHLLATINPVAELTPRAHRVGTVVMIDGTQAVPQPPHAPRAIYDHFYACTRHDAAEIGFDDDFIYEQLPLEIAARSLPMEQIEREHSLELFREWATKPDKISY